MSRRSDGRLRTVKPTRAARPKRARAALASYAMRSWRRALGGGGRGWFYMAVVTTGVRVTLRAIERREDVLAFRLRPGDAVEIRHLARRK